MWKFLRAYYCNNYVKYCNKFECNRVNVGAGWSSGKNLCTASTISLAKNAKYVKYINF